MRFKIPIAVVLLAGSLAGVAAASMVTNASSAVSPKGRCIEQSIKRGTHDLIVAQGACYNQAGQKVPQVWSTSYEQFDYARQGCNINPETQEPGMIGGPNTHELTPKLGGTYSVKVTFTLRAKSAKGIKPVSRTASFTLGHTARMCGQMDGLNTVPTGTVCNPNNNTYTTFGTGEIYTCGQLYTVPGYTGPELPQWNGTAPWVNGVVYNPPINTPCTLSTGPAFNFWGGTEHLAHWQCGKVAVEGHLILHYIPPAGNPDCTAVLVSDPDDLAQFSLPNGWQSWGGQLVVVWRLEDHLPLHSGWSAIGFSVTTIPLPGAADACNHIGEVG